MKRIVEEIQDISKFCIPMISQVYNLTEAGQNRSVHDGTQTGNCLSKSTCGARNAAHKIALLCKVPCYDFRPFQQLAVQVGTPTNPTSYLELCLEYIFTTKNYPPVPVPKFPNRKNQSGRTWVLLLGDTSQ